MVEFNIALLLFVLTVYCCEPIQIGLASMLLDWSARLEQWADDKRAQIERDRRG